MTRPLFTGLKLHGLVFDINPEDVIGDRWTNGRNIYFVTGDTLRVEGINAYAGSLLFPAEVVHYVDTGSQEWWLYGSGSGVGVTNGINHYDITPTGWGPIATKNLILSIGDLNTLPWINHPERGPFWWDGDPAHKMTKLPDWPTSWSCRVMRSFKNFLFAMAIDTGTTLAENQLSWSSSADPGQVPTYWVPSPTNDAGDMTFATPGGPLIGGVALRDQFFVSKVNATFAMAYTGGQFVFQQRTVFPSIGLYGPNALIEHGGFVYMLTGSGRFVRHDGNSEQSILYGVAEQYLARTINAEWDSSPFCYQTDMGDVVALAYPAGTGRECTEALGIEIASLNAEGPPDIGVRDLPGCYSASSGFTAIVVQSWDSDPAAWDSDVTKWNEQQSGYRPPHMVFACGAQGLGELGNGVTVFGAPIEAYAERTGMELGDFGSHKVLSGAFPRLSGNGGETVFYRFGGQEQVDAAIQWSAEMAVTIGATQQLDFFQDGRLIAHAIRSSGGSPWRSNGVQLLARKGGRW